MNVATTAKDDARQAHIDLMNRYAQAIDTCDWDLLASLYTEDVVFTGWVLKERRLVEPDVMRLEGRDALVTGLSKVIEGLSATHHMLGNYVVDLDPDGVTAKASCYMRAYHAGAGPRAHLFEETLGRFELETVRKGSEWRIRRMNEFLMIILGDVEAFAPKD